MNAEQLKDAIAYSPPPKSTPPDLVGHWTRAGFFLCASCASRLIGRGFGSELTKTAWKGDVSGVCFGCSSDKRDANGDKLPEQA